MEYNAEYRIPIKSRWERMFVAVCLVVPITVIDLVYNFIKSSVLVTLRGVKLVVDLVIIRLWFTASFLKTNWRNE